VWVYSAVPVGLDQIKSHCPGIEMPGYAQRSLRDQVLRDLEKRSGTSELFQIRGQTHRHLRQPVAEVLIQLPPPPKHITNTFTRSLMRLLTCHGHVKRHVNTINRSRPFSNLLLVNPAKNVLRVLVQISRNTKKTHFPQPPSIFPERNCLWHPAFRSLQY